MTNVGYATLSVIPSLKGTEAALNKEIDRTFGPAGTKAGSELSRGIEAQVKKTDFDGTKIVKDADDVGDKAGKQMRHGIEGELKKVDGKSTFGPGLALGALALSGGAIVGGKMLFDAASDLNESTSKAKVVFGDNFAQIDLQAQGAAKSLGISRQQALESSATFGNLFRAMGIGTDQAAGMSTNINTLASDLASFNNAKPEDVLLALKSGLVGETEPLRAFGVNLNEARIKSEALRLGLVKGNVSAIDVTDKTQKLAAATKKQADIAKTAGYNSVEYAEATNAVAKAEADLNDELAGKVPELTAAQKAQAAYNLILEDTSLAQGDFARTADGAANKQRILSASFEDAKAKLGEALLPLGTTLMDQALKGLEGVQSWWDENGEGLKARFHETFGEDPGANFSAGLDIVKSKVGEVFSEENLASFQAGAGVVSAKVHEIFGEDPGQSLRNGLMEIGTTAIDVKDHYLDPLFGSIQSMGDVGADAFGQFRDGFLDPMLGMFQTIAENWNKLDLPISFKVPDWIPGVGGKEWVVDDIFPDIPGFDTGGVAPGPIGQGLLALVHGGETILPTHNSAFSALRGVNPSDLMAPPTRADSGGVTVQQYGVPLHDPESVAWAARKGAIAAQRAT